MTSRLSGRIAADANVLLAASVGGAAARVFLEAKGLRFLTTEVTLIETKKYLPLLAEKYGLGLWEVAENARTLALEVCAEDQYRSHLGQARSYLAEREPDDVALAALALKLSIPIWSNDRDFEEVPVEVYTTARLHRGNAGPGRPGSAGRKRSAGVGRTIPIAADGARASGARSHTSAGSAPERRVTFLDGLTGRANGSRASRTAGL